MSSKRGFALRGNEPKNATQDVPTSPQYISSVPRSCIGRLTCRAIVVNRPQPDFDWLQKSQSDRDLRHGGVS